MPTADNGIQTDSSQFATHLRLVQFTIILTSVALVISALETPGGVVARAHADLRRIVQLSSSWNSDELKLWLDEMSPAPALGTVWVGKRTWVFGLTV